MGTQDLGDHAPANHESFRLGVLTGLDQQRSRVQSVREVLQRDTVEGVLFVELFALFAKHLDDFVSGVLQPCVAVVALWYGTCLDVGGKFVTTPVAKTKLDLFVHSGGCEDFYDLLNLGRLES